jgi:hypothetical protein
MDWAEHFISAVTQDSIDGADGVVVEGVYRGLRRWWGLVKNGGCEGGEVGFPDVGYWRKRVKVMVEGVLVAELLEVPKSALACVESLLESWLVAEVKWMSLLSEHSERSPRIVMTGRSRKW